VRVCLYVCLYVCVCECARVCVCALRRPLIRLRHELQYDAVCYRLLQCFAVCYSVCLKGLVRRELPQSHRP